MPRIPAAKQPAHLNPTPEQTAAADQLSGKLHELLLTLPGATEAFAERFLVAWELCHCGHSRNVHNAETRAMTCLMGACECRVFDPTHVQLSYRTVVVLEVPKVTG